MVLYLHKSRINGISERKMPIKSGNKLEDVVKYARNAMLFDGYDGYAVVNGSGETIAEYCGIRLGLAMGLVS
jgi:hypothetical protein